MNSFLNSSSGNKYTTCTMILFLITLSECYAFYFDDLFFISPSECYTRH